jgi:hypothetical protein
MKKTIFLLVLFAGAFLSEAFGKNNANAAFKTDGITTLIINADVTVVLVDNNSAFEVFGNRRLNSLVHLDRTADTLFINAAKNADLREAGIIYIPVKGLQKIQINSEAQVRSLDVLDVAKLDVVVNGACLLSLSHTGGIRIIETENYQVEMTLDRHALPAGFRENRKNLSRINL